MIHIFTMIHVHIIQNTQSYLYINKIAFSLIYFYKQLLSKDALEKSNNIYTINYFFAYDKSEQ